MFNFFYIIKMASFNRDFTIETKEKDEECVAYNEIFIIEQFLLIVPRNAVPNCRLKVNNHQSDPTLKVTII